jgi:glycosyltransferase involved in cell wall biosynthesis
VCSEESGRDSETANYNAAIGYDALIMSDGSPLVVGLSSNVLESSGRGARPDGIAVYTRELGNALEVEGVQIRRIGAPHFVGSKMIRAHDAHASFSVPLPYLAAAKALRLPVPTAGAIERDIRIYHATDYLVPKLRRTPVVATIYDAIPLAHPAWTNPRLRSLKNWLLRTSAESADRVIAISHAAVSELVDHYRIPRERIRVVPLGVHSRWFEKMDEKFVNEVLAKYRLEPGYILHVGTLQPRKNLEKLLAAYEALPQHVQAARQLVLVGKYGWGAEKLREKLELQRAMGRIVWLDYVNEAELGALYQRAGLFAYPSLAEGFGLPVVEALACGLPVVANDLPVLRETADCYAEFADANDVSDLAAAILRAQEHRDSPERRQERQQHARRFDWKTCARRTIDVYRELVR